MGQGLLGVICLGRREVWDEAVIIEHFLCVNKADGTLGKKKKKAALLSIYYLPGFFSKQIV